MRLRSKKDKGFYFSNPFLVYSVIWLTVLWLVSLQLIDFLGKLNVKTLVLVFSNIISFGIVFFLLSYNSVKRRLSVKEIIQSNDLNKLNGFVHKLIIIWVLGTIIEIFFAGGLPMLWLLTSNSIKDYSTFGIPTFHGMMNAFYMFSLAATYLVYYLKRERKKYILFISLLVWPILVFSRGLMVWSILEILGIYLLLEKITLSKIIKLVIILLSLIISFGLMGDFRLGDKTIFIHASVNAEEIFSHLPTGFYWFYLYTTMGINNVNAALNNLQPTYSFFNNLIAFFPSVVREIFLEPGKYPLELVVEGYTASTYYASFLHSFGMYGSIFIVIIIQIIVVLFYKFAIRGKLWSILAYAVLFQSLMLSVFWDTFTSLLTIVQIFFALYFKRISRIHRPSLETSTNTIQSRPGAS